MNGDSSEKKSSRVGTIKKLLIAILVLLLIVPNIVSIALLIRQSQMQEQIDILSQELARLRLGTFGDLGRISGGRTGTGSG